jgi:hypothetical protein
MPYFRVVCIALVWLGAGACVDRRESSPRSQSRTSADSLTEAIVQAQVDAYNNRDLSAFLKHFSQDAKLYTFPDTLLFAGADTLRSVYGQLFAAATQLKAEVTNRVVQGRFVIDREITTGMPGRGPHTGIAIYEVRGGLITRVWFLD